MATIPAGNARLSRRQFVVSGIVGGTSLLVPFSGAGRNLIQTFSESSTEELLDSILDLANPDRAVEALIEVFARSGIAVFDDAVTQPLVQPLSPISPLSFQRWQLGAMIQEMVSGGGRAVGEYDAIFPDTTADGEIVPTVGELLAGYAESGVSPGSLFTKAYFDRWLVPNLNLGPADLPAPAAITSLLGGEILGQLQQAAGLGASNQLNPVTNLTDRARYQPAAMAFAQVPGINLPGLPELPPIPGGLATPLPAVEGNTVCGMVQSFISIVMQRVFSVLKAAEAVENIPIIGGILGALLRGAQLGINAITKAVDALLAPVLGVIKAIAAGLAVASMLIGTLTPWTVAIDLRPTRTRFGIDAEVVTGEIGVTAGGWDRVDYPPALRECASLVDIKLPSPSSKDAPVVIQARQSVPLITLQTSNVRLDETGTATATYQTQNESAVQAAGDELIGVAWISTTVTREDLLRLRDSLANLLFSQLPDLIAGVVRPLVGPTLDQLSSQLIDLVKVYASQPLFVVYHKPPDTPTPPAEPTPTATADVATETVGCFPGTFILADPFAIQRMFIPFPMDVTGSNTWDFRGDGTVEITFNGLVLTLHPDPSAQFTFAFSGNQLGTYTAEGGVLSVTITENNAVMDTDMIALQGQINGPTPMTGALTGPYTCGPTILWQVSIPEVGVVPYEFVPV